MIERKSSITTENSDVAATSKTSNPGGGPGTFSRGVHPGEHKNLASGAAIEVLPAPKQVKIPLAQHTGAPNEPVHKPAAPVKLGDVIGSCGAFVSAPIHSSVNGKIAPPSVTTLPNGRHVKCVTVNADPEQPGGQALFEEIFGGEWPTDGLEGRDPKAMVQAVRDAGLVGLGGAAFPTHVKLAVREDKPIDTILVNGCECEPYLTADERLILEAPAPVITGALLTKIATGARHVIVCIEENKPGAIEAMRKAAGSSGVLVKAMKTKYPQGGEKQLIPAALGRVVPTGGLPLDVGAVVINVGTAAALARAVLRGKPLTHRVLSVTGGGVKQPKNLLAPIGVSYAEMINFCGGLTPEAARVVAGGPMMGFTLGQLDTPVTKGTSGITVLTKKDVAAAAETACVRCGRCVDVCPLNLVPTKLAHAVRYKHWEQARQYHLAACMECGCCAYACPAMIPLVQLMRAGKAMMPK